MTKESSSVRRSSCGPSISGAQRFHRASDVHTTPTWSSKPSGVSDDDTAIATRSENQDDVSAQDGGAMRDALDVSSTLRERVYERTRRATSIASSSPGRRRSALLSLDKVSAARDGSLHQKRDVPPTALEALLDSELFDAHTSVSTTHDDNQFALQQEQQQADDDFGELGSLSLELLVHTARRFEGPTTLCPYVYVCAYVRTRRRCRVRMASIRSGRATTLGTW